MTESGRQDGTAAVVDEDSSWLNAIPVQTLSLSGEVTEEDRVEHGGIIPAAYEPKPGINMRVSCAWLTAISSLKTLVRANLQHFSSSLSVEHRGNDRFYQCFADLEDHTNSIQPMIEFLNQNAHKYDFDNIPANGFRSLLAVANTCMCKLVQTSRAIQNQRETFFFKKNVYTRDLEEYTKVLGGLRKMLQYAGRMMEQDDKSSSLFPKEGNKTIEEWFQDVETLDQEIFYGRSLGFQYCSSVHTLLQTIALALAICAETYHIGETRKPGSVKLATTMPNMFITTKFLMKPELRAKQIVHTTRNCDINFCKQFWGLTEAGYLQSGFNWILPSVAVNRVIELSPDLIQVVGVAGKSMYVKPPSLSKPIYTRLISDVENSGNGKELSSSLIFHCHGGGFIAQSSKAHESYLLKWAKDLKVPIFSIDYALAPEDPYPRGLDEVVYAYAWALKNHKELGWTGEKVCFVGDSAGANLVVGAALKIFCKGLKAPTGILAAYGAFLIQYTPSPSRLLCLMDPVLPMGILTRCLAAYAGIPEPSCVGKVQGANDKVSQTNVQSEPADKLVEEDPGNSNSSKRNGFIISSHPVPNSTENGDVTDGSAIHQPHVVVPPSSHWFGKAVTSLFKNIQAKPIEAANELASDDQPEARTLNSMRRTSEPGRVEPLPRYNFAMVSVEDPFLSPVLAEDHILMGLPPIYLVACNLDPLLDDSISFARRLKQLDKPVQLDVVNNLPHGFLNFSVLSNEAAEATALCGKRILQILQGGRID